jgi:hypothetical protein
MEAAASDPKPITAFVATLGARDPKTVAAYHTFPLIGIFCSYSTGGPNPVET